MADVTLRVNKSSTDKAYADMTSGEDLFEDVDANVDELIFSEGSAAVADGEDLPTEEELNRAGTELSESSQVIVSKYFLGDNSADLLREIFLAGNQNKRYVFCAAFDDATASEPQLEAWDDDDYDSYTSPALGGGTPSASWYKAICTTDGLPGADWTGTPLGGDDSSNVVLLNSGNGALSAAKDLYFNFKVVIPAGYVTPGVANPVLAIVFTSN